MKFKALLSALKMRKQIFAARKIEKEASKISDIDILNLSKNSEKNLIS
jgi:hypothetical protein